MNIFVVDTDPIQAAQDLPDKLVVKMPTETCQMLATNFGPDYLGWGLLPRKPHPYALFINSKGKTSWQPLPCKKKNLSLFLLGGQPIITHLVPMSTNSHRNHPCTIWARENFPQMAWLIAHGLGLVGEYTHRYDQKQHGTKLALLVALDFFHKKSGRHLSCFNLIPDDEFIRAMPEDLKINQQISHVHAYRCYMHRKTYPAWKRNRPAPKWWLSQLKGVRL